MLAVSTRAFALGAKRSTLSCKMAAGNHLANYVSNMSTAQKERPVSPHITIYSFPLAAISSITTRITGGLLGVGVIGIGLGSLVGADMPAMMAALGSSGVGPLVKLSVAFPLSYHYIAACRHLYWEKKPEGLNSESQKSSSMAIFGAAGVISLALMVV